MQRKNISTGSIWEEKVGYSRAVVIGSRCYVTGTTSVDDQGNVVGVNNGYEQAAYILKKIDNVLKDADFSSKDIVRTRMYVTDISRWEEYGKAHSEYLGNVKPCATMVEIKGLVNPDMLIEIEVDAEKSN